MMPNKAEDTDGQNRRTRRTVLRNVALAAGALPLGTGLFSSSAVADAPDTKEQDLTGTELFNPCTGEAMRATDGTRTIREDFQMDSDGGLHGRVQWNTDGAQFVGLDSGQIYHAHDSYSNVLNLKPPFPQTVTETNEVRVISEGRQENWKTFEVNYHLTITASGDPAIERLELTTPEDAACFG